ncbi:hypothetical protein R1flu_010704 [Riccia fluitans]|uniref:Reverse transcriptase domain-containing protein n=1 Tax=Riccia fluitans TaxID=41844 RepID=A0ABD1Z8U4_9MARC
MKDTTTIQKSLFQLVRADLYWMDQPLTTVVDPRTLCNTLESGGVLRCPLPWNQLADQLGEQLSWEVCLWREWKSSRVKLVQVTGGGGPTYRTMITPLSRTSTSVWVEGAWNQVSLPNYVGFGRLLGSSLSLLDGARGRRPRDWLITIGDSTGIGCSTLQEEVWELRRAVGQMKLYVEVTWGVQDAINRTILVRIATVEDRDKILVSRSLLRGKRVWLDLDLTPSQLDAKRREIAKVKAANEADQGSNCRAKAFLQFGSIYDLVILNGITAFPQTAGITCKTGGALVRGHMAGENGGCKDGGQGETGPPMQRKGCPLSPTLFGIFINDLERWLQEQGGEGVRLGQFVVQLLSFADDVVILACELGGLLLHLEGLNSFCLATSMRVNFAKTKWMCFGSRPIDSLPFQDQVIEKRVRGLGASRLPFQAMVLSWAKGWNRSTWASDILRRLRRKLPNIKQVNNENP